MKKQTQKGCKRMTTIKALALVAHFCFFSVVWAKQEVSSTIPIYNNKFYEKGKKKKQLSFLGEGDGKILDSTKKQLDKWDDQRTHVEDWNLASTGLYKLPSYRQKASFVGGRFIKFFDRWISKKAKEGKTPAFKKAHQVQKNLNPKKKLSLSEDFKVSFGTHLLRARAYMVLENAYFDYITTASPSRGMDIRMGKNIGKNGLRTDINYNIKGYWEASINRPIAENLYARLSSASYHGNAALSKAANNIIQLLYNKGF